MWCGVKYTYGHSCVKSQLYQILLEDNEDSNQEEEVFTDCVETMEDTLQVRDDSQQLVISLHAMLGTGNTQTMRLQGKLKNTKVIILVDSRSTHNFMNCSVAKRVGCST